jgi:hypothetical protein
MSYNPFVSAAKAAAAALTSEDAKAYYVSRSLEDIDRVITVFEAVYSVCSFVYSLGALAGEAHYAAVCTHTKAEPGQKCLPKPRAIAALPPAKPCLPKPPIAALPPALVTLAKRELIDRCIARGLKPKKTMRKAELLALLTA